MFTDPNEFKIALRECQSPAQAKAILSDFRTQVAAGCTPWKSPVVARRRRFDQEEIARLQAEGEKLLEGVM